MNLTPDQRRAAEAVSRSFERDADRAKQSYTEHTATALRRRALAAGNGHAKPHA